MADLLYLIPLLPLVAFVINIFWGAPRYVGTLTGSPYCGPWFVDLSIITFREIYTNEEPLTQRLFT